MLYEGNFSLSESHGDYYGVGPLIISLVLSFLSILYVSYFATRRMTKLLSANVPFKNLIKVVVFGSHSSTDYGVVGDSMGFEDNLRKILVWLSLIFVMLLAYISMSLTSWGTMASMDTSSSTGGVIATSASEGEVSMYMNAIGGWISIALYILGLLVPH